MRRILRIAQSAAIGVAAWSLAVAPPFAQPRFVDPEIVLQTGNLEPETLVFTKDGHYLASAGEDRNVLVWDVRTGRVLHRLEGQIDAVHNLAFSNDGRWLAVGASRRLVGTPVHGESLVWNFRTNERKILKGAGGAIAFASNTTVISRAAENILKLWDVRTGLPVASLGSVANGSANITPGPDSRSFLCDCNGRSIEIRSLKDGAVLRTIGNDPAYALSPDRRLLAWKPTPRTIQVMDLGQGTEKHFIKSDLSSFSFDPDGRWIVGFETGHITAFELIRTDVSGRQLAIPGSSAYGRFALGSSGKLATVVNGEVSIFSFPQGALVRSLNAGAANYGAHDVSPDGRILAMGADNGRIVLWSAGLGRPIDTRMAKSSSPKYASVPTTIESLVFSRDGEHLASTAGSIWTAFQNPGPPVLVLGTRTGQQTAVIDTSPDQGMSRLAAARAQDWIAVTTANGIDIRSVPGGERVQSLAGHEKWTTSAAFSPDGHWLATGGGAGDGKTILWEIRSGWQKLVLSADPKDSIQALAFSQDSRLLASGDASGKIVVWDLERRAPLRSIDAHSAWVSALAFSADGRSLVSGSWDQTIKIWDVRNGALLQTLRGHTSTVRAVSYLSGQLLSSSEDGTVRVWSPDRPDPVATVFSFGNDKWLVVTPEGLFDGTAEAMPLVGWRQSEMDVAPADIFYNDFFHPDLLAQILEGRRPRPEIDIATVVQVPGLRTMLVQKQAHVETRGGNLVVCFADNPRILTQSPVTEPDVPINDPRGFRVVPEDRACKYQLALPRLGAGQSDIRKKLENWQQLPALTTPWDGVFSKAGDSTLHVVSIGVGQYPANSRLDALPYAVPSARAVEAFFTKQPGAANAPYARMRIWPGLFDAAATKGSIQQRFRDLARATAEGDVVLIYLVGHGIVDTRQEMFYFMPFDAREETAREAGLSTANLADALRSLPARRIVLVIDACQSGGAVEALGRIGEARARAGERQAKLDGRDVRDLRYGVGIHIIAAATPLSYAANVSSDRSFLAATLLQFLEGTRGTAGARQMIEYVEKRLPEESQKTIANFRQIPLTRSIGLDFPL